MSPVSTAPVRVPAPRRAPEPKPWTQIPLFSVVLECGDCHEVWEPAYGMDPDEASLLACPHCDGPVFAGELAEGRLL